MVASKFNFNQRNAGGQKKAVMQGAIARRMAAQGQKPNAKEQSSTETDQAAQSSRNKQVGR